MDFETKKKYYNLCDPYEPLEPDDERNVDFDKISEESGDFLRGVNWADELLESINLSENPVSKFFTGHPGSGKTTELKRVLSRISDPQSANLFPVYINAENVLNLNRAPGIADIIPIIISSVEEAIANATGKNPEEALKSGYLKKLWEWLTREDDFELSKKEFSIPKIAKFVYEVKERESLRDKINQKTQAQFSEFIYEARTYLEELDKKVKTELNRHGIIIIFDTLEKVGEKVINSDDYEDILIHTEQVFKSPHIRLPVNIIYTFPPALINRIELDEFFLPMIKVLEKETREANPAGLVMMREMIEKRLPFEILKRMFGDDIKKMKNKINKFILSSGGYTRDLLRMLQSAVKYHDNSPLSEKIIERIITNICNRYRRFVSRSDAVLLAQIANDKYLTVEDLRENAKSAARMLNKHTVLYYMNDDEWFDLHPAVYTIPIVRQAIDRDKKEKQRIISDLK